MYETKMWGTSEPHPSGFRLKFGNKWTGLFGAKGALPPKVATSAEVQGGRAQLVGASFNTNPQADFLAFHICAGGLTTVKSKADIMTTVAGTVPQTLQSGCFNTPMAGKFDAATGNRVTARANQYCQIRSITSWNE